ncbi:MAG TPA: acyltransferase [Rhodanobacteraceae bacterium]|nr:acyltransferase [Rhodanobacteraceae bacterium]
MENTPAGGVRLRYIDALRGIAALLVLWLHVASTYRALSPATAAHGRWISDFAADIDIGRIGVVVFFLISGFVVPFSIHADSAAPVQGFAIRRFFRIFPAYWLSVPLAAFAFFWIAGLPFSTGEFLVNLTLLQDVVGVRPAEGVYWTLLVELVFYALCIALLLSRSLFSARRVAILAVSLALLHVFAMFMQWLGKPVVGIALAFWPLNLSLMFFGALYRLQAAARDRVASVLMPALAAFYALALPLCAMLAAHRLPTYTIAYALGFIVFIAGTRFVRIETRLTDWLGRISYSVYLLHPIAAELLYRALLREPVESAWRTQHLAVYLAVVAALTLAAAALAYRFVEAPAIRLGHRFAARRERGIARNDTGLPRDAEPATT